MVVQTLKKRQVAVQTLKKRQVVIPAKAGTHFQKEELGPRLRGGDIRGRSASEVHSEQAFPDVQHVLRLHRLVQPRIRNDMDLVVGAPPVQPEVSLAAALRRAPAARERVPQRHAALEAVGAQVFPKDPTHPYYVECVNLPENGVAPPSGNDYNACPLTDRLRARLVEKQS